jgi:peroxiredoxin
MSPLSAQRRFGTMMKLGMCAFFLGVVSAAGGLRAEEVSPLPRYRLSPGQELRYRGQSEFKYGKEDNVGTLGSTVDWQAWVVQANAVGGWRLVVRSSTKDWSTYGKDAKRSEQPARSEMACIDLTPDGRVSSNDTPNSRLQPETLFPRLPADATAMAKGWEGDRDDGFVHLEFKANSEASSTKTWDFDETSNSPFDKIYLSSAHTKFTFDTKRGLMERADSENTKGYGFDGKGTGTTELVAVKDHDEAWAKGFADEADRYFKAERTYQDLLTAANHDAKSAEETLAKAEAVLKDARDTLKMEVFTEQLDSQLSEHKNQVRWITDEAKEIAERKDTPAAEWKLDDLDGKSHALADYRGKVVVLDFWYRGCGWCIRAMPQIQQLADDFKGDPVAVLGMNKDRDEQDARFVVDAMHLTYPILKATGVPEKYGVHGFPTLVVIDQKGTVRDIHIGFSKTLRADVSKVIRELLDGRSPANAVAAPAATVSADAPSKGLPADGKTPEPKSAAPDAPAALPKQPSSNRDVSDADQKASRKSTEAIASEFSKLMHQIERRRKDLDDETDAADRKKHEREIKELETRLNDLRLQSLKDSIRSATTRGPNGGDIQPDRIDVGEVYVSSTVEASVRVFYDPVDTAGVSVKVDPPPFVRIKSVVLDHQDFGVRSMSYCDISVSINTSLGAGDRSGRLRVDIGNQVREIPISAKVLARTPNQIRVLVVSSPFTSVSTEQASAFDPWLKIVKDARLNVDYWLPGGRQSPFRDQDLSKFDVILLQNDGLWFLQKQDVENLKRFLSEGGRLVVVASAFMMGSVDKANELILPYGLQMVDSELMDRIDLRVDDIQSDTLTHGVRRIAVHRPTPVVVRSSPFKAPASARVLPKLLVKFPGAPSASREALVASVKVDKGELIVLGVPLWWTWIGGELGASSDNPRLLQNLLTVTKQSHDLGELKIVPPTPYRAPTLEERIAEAFERPLKATQRNRDAKDYARLALKQASPECNFGPRRRRGPRAGRPAAA